MPSTAYSFANDCALLRHELPSIAAQSSDRSHNAVIHLHEIIHLHGPLFFASVTSFKDQFDPKNDPADVAIDFYFSRVYDQSAMEAINSLAEKYGQNGKRQDLTHLSQECRVLLDRAGDLVEVNLSEDPRYHVATDRIIPSLTKQSDATQGRLKQGTQQQSELAPAATVAG